MTHDQQTWRWSISTIGLGLFGLSLLQFLVEDDAGLTDTLQVVVPLVLSGVLFWYGVRLALDEEFDAYERVLVGCLLGGGLLTILGVWTVYLQLLEGSVLDESIHIVMGDATVGAVLGTIIGRYEAGQYVQRREAEAARESAEEYREIFEKVDEGIAIDDPETGTFVEVNQRYAEMVGYEQEELRDMSIGAVSADDPSFDQDAAMGRIEQVMAGEPQTFDWLLERKDGSQLWTEVSLKLATVGGTERILAVVRDITDRREREEQIREQKRRLDTLVENLPIVLFALDAEGEITLLEGEGLSSLGLDPGELVGESAYDVYADNPDLLDAVDRALDGESVNTVLTLGDTILEAWYTPVMEAGEVERVIGSAIDITDREKRKQQLAELHESSRRLAYAASLEEVAETTVEIARDVLEMPVSTLWRYDEDRDCLVAIAMTDSSKDILGVESIDGLDPITDGELGMEVFRSGEVWSTDDYGTVENAAFDVPLGNVILVPLADNGLLEVGQLDVEETSDEMRQRADILALNATTALARIDRERELERAQERFRALSENSPIGIVTIDDSSTVQFANPAIGDILGYDAEDVVGESITTVIPERLRQDHREGIQRYLETGERNLDWSGIELPAQHADGHEVDIEVSFGELELDDVHLFTGIIRDISDRKQQEQQIRALQRATIELADAATVAEIYEMGVEIASDLLDRPLSVFWTYDPDRDVLVPQAATDAVDEFTAEHGIDGAPVYEEGSLEMEAFRSGETIIGDNYQAFEGRPDLTLGSVIITPVANFGVLAFASPELQEISDSDRYIVDILSRSIEAALDRSHHRELLRERTEELEIRTSQMEFINSIIRHDVLNGMTVIRSRAEFMSDDLEGQPREYAETIVNWCDNITGLAERVQTVVRTLTDKESVDLEPIDVARLVEEEFTRLDQTYPGVTFERDLPEEVLVRADELLADVIGNVATNAIEHNDREDLIVSASASIEGDRAVVRIRDNGQGIPPDELESVFRRGESHAKTAGSGFGLFFVDAMMEAYGGDVWVENDDGAVFVLELPLADASPKRHDA